MNRAPFWQRPVWWWYRVTGRDCSRWLRWLMARAERRGGGFVFIPTGTYFWGDPNGITLGTITGEGWKEEVLGG